ncbi:MAG TPA: 3-hydroxyacyl-CoA dehydrogenase NAD-binding domain-containing protein [Acidimicrobiia bacterium]|nr:3-hydroxyacyl-CoA dehydrogenase NAD-binding domain-containing protein [Acidimicrobiia bacterium]
MVGTGVIGAGWAVRALSRGWEVLAWDPALGADERLRAAVARAWPAVTRLGLYPAAAPDRVVWAGSMEEVGEGSDFVQESSPENLTLKQDLLAVIDSHTRPEVVIASSTSGLLPSKLGEKMGNPERLVVGHPFNPVYLLPLVEVVAGSHTSPEAVTKAIDLYRDLDMHPLLVRHEVDGFLADRLLEALWREILHLVAEGVATTDELDRAISYGPGLRWAGMGTNLIYHLAGGDGGMEHMLSQFGPALEWPWSKLTAPPLTPELVKRLVDGTQEQAGGRTAAELEALRDQYLVAVLYALRSVGIGAGQTLARREARTLAASAPSPWQAGQPVPAPLPVYECRVLPEWVDYNRHMTESAYLYVFGWASDGFFRFLGLDEQYRQGGHSFYTVESHLVYRREASTGDLLRLTTQLLGHDQKRIHLFHQMFHGETGELLCTNEQLLVHVDMAAGKSAPILPGPLRVLDEIDRHHRQLERPPAVMNIPGRV